MDEITALVELIKTALVNDRIALIQARTALVDLVGAAQVSLTGLF